MPTRRDSRDHRIGKCRKRSNPLRIYREKEFVARYRLSKKVVRKLARRFAPYNSTKGKRNGGGLSHEEKLCLALRYFATGSIMATVGDTQHVSKRLVSDSVRDVSNYFYRKSRKYIHWPATFAEKMELSKKFYTHKNQGTPNVFACVDGTHIAVKAPKVNESCFVNRSSYHSINTTIYCDYDKRILNVDPRWPGSVNDAYAFHCSPVGDLVKSENLGKFIILGDSGYALKKNVFVPFRKTATPQQERFNVWHRSNRARVENTIGILKQRWRCLDSSSGYLYHKPERAAKVIQTCCCLHNVAMDHGIKIINHPNDPWYQTRQPLPQPKRRRQRTRTQIREDIRKVREKYAETHF